MSVFLKLIKKALIPIFTSLATEILSQVISVLRQLAQDSDGNSTSSKSQEQEPPTT